MSIISDDGSSSDNECPTRDPTLVELVERAAHLLPAQGPIEVFVHHNTLHAFEAQSFHDAVKHGFARYHAEPYLTEQEYRRLHRIGRVTDRDLEAVVCETLGERGSDEISGLGTRSEIHYAMLRHEVLVGPDAELRWIVAETDAIERFRSQTTQINRVRTISSAKRWLKNADEDEVARVGVGALLAKFGRDASRWTDANWESFSLHLLWRACLNGIRQFPRMTPTMTFSRPRDLLLHATGKDIDREVKETLIRFCAAFVDQGYSNWVLPNRERGFFESFVALYCVRVCGTDRWLRRLSKELAVLIDSKTTAEESIEISLRELGISPELREEFITQSLLALAGWAGIIWQLESGVDWASHTVPRGSLVGMLAVRLILEKHAIRSLGEAEFGESVSLVDILHSARARLAEPQEMSVERRAFLLFQVAQMLGWTPLELLRLSSPQWRELSDEVERFSSIERRHVFQKAYERRYHHSALDALAIHSARRVQLSRPWGERRPKFQLATCIDDREESLRRHLEEVEPLCETFAAAGYFAVAMYYRGAADGFYKPLCPGVMTPEHYVREDVGYTFEGVHRERAVLRRRLGRASHAFNTLSRTFVGGMLAGVVGSLATIPLVARVLFPHLTARIRRRFGSLLQPPPVTRLQLERYADEPGPNKGHVGYSSDEMARVVLHLLQDMGLTKSEHFSRLFIVCGHGSSSLNNPHESAYCCGACAGKRGGPNARAFAQMANDWRVRAKVASLGLAIPEDAIFVGAYHNTCDDSIVFYDLDRMPASHRDDFDDARSSIEHARRRNAQERCRRFISAPLDISSQEALRHVEERAQDISQVRPEYNHATNALCLVGRRDWSRGLFLDRRAFLNSYDPAQDDAESSVLARILAAAVPVCAGINLEYYFSRVDVAKYGSGSKLPHNIVSLLGVMEGTSSDLRTGLHQQMVEIHDPLRILFVIQSTPEVMLTLMQRNAAIGRLVRGSWIYLATIDPATSEIQIFRDGEFHRYDVSKTALAEVSSSRECYQGSREHLPFSSIRETSAAT